MPEHVILLHGLWMRGFTLRPLARRLRAAGYTVDAIEYASVYGGVDRAAARLRERMRAADAPAVHLVGHSLGALVSLEAARDGRDLPPGRIVCIGPPLRGSAVARRFARLRVGRWLLGRSADVLAAGTVEWTDTRRVGVIAGSLPFGLGGMLGMLDAPHDGTVALTETHLRGIADHRTVAASHTGLLFSREVARLTSRFLRNGHFGA
jgi:pimeloyl-ACP methyl ester carboxylesterase